MFRWIRGLYDKTLALSKHPQAIYWLALISFLESSIFPIPPDVLLLPILLANRERAFRIASICTLASIAGGAMGYLIGMYGFDVLGKPILEFYGAMDRYAQFQQWYDEFGGIMVFIAGLTPIPYKVITISSGLFEFNFLMFLLLSLASRGFRFGLEALIIRKYGEQAIVLIDRHFNKLTILGGVLFVGGFLVIKLFFSH